MGWERLIDDLAPSCTDASLPDFHLNASVARIARKWIRVGDSVDDLVGRRLHDLVGGAKLRAVEPAQRGYSDAVHVEQADALLPGKLRRTDAHAVVAFSLILVAMYHDGIDLGCVLDGLRTALRSRQLDRNAHEALDSLPSACLSALALLTTSSSESPSSQTWRSCV